MLTWGMMPLGTLPLGWLSDGIGASLSVGLSGVLVVIFSITVALRLPRVRNL